MTAPAATDGVELGRIERVLPFGDDEGRDRVADDIGQRRAGCHQAIDPEEKAEPVERQGAHGLQGPPA
jgi:hypothetical protein